MTSLYGACGRQAHSPASSETPARPQTTILVAPANSLKIRQFPVVRTPAIVSYLFLIAATFNSSSSGGSSVLGPVRKQHRATTCYVLCSNDFAENRPAILSSTLLYVGIQPGEIGLARRCYDVSTHVYWLRRWRELGVIFATNSCKRGFKKHTS